MSEENNNLSSENDSEVHLASHGLDSTDDNTNGNGAIDGISKVEKQIDFLFYLKTKESPCLYDFYILVKRYGFLKYFNHLKWQASFSFYSDNADLLPLASNNAISSTELNLNPSPARIEFERNLFIYNRLASPHGYVLSYNQRTERFRKRLFKMTLAPVYLKGYPPGRGVSIKKSVSHLNTKAGVKDPLVGLSDILTNSPRGSIREDSHVVVLLFSDFPFYSNEKWEEFFEEHDNVSFVVLNPLVFKENQQREHLLSTGAVSFVDLCRYGEPSEESLNELVEVIQGKF